MLERKQGPAWGGHPCVHVHAPGRVGWARNSLGRRPEELRGSAAPLRVSSGASREERGKLGLKPLSFLSGWRGGPWGVVLVVGGGTFAVFHRIKAAIDS